MIISGNFWADHPSRRFGHATCNSDLRFDGQTQAEESASRRQRRDAAEAQAAADAEFKRRVLAIIGPDMCELATAIVQLQKAVGQ